MADAEALKSFFISLGWQVDEAGAKKFSETVTRRTREVAEFEKTEKRNTEEEIRRAKGRDTRLREGAATFTKFATAAVAAAAAVSAAIIKAADAGDKLNTSSQRVGSSASNLRGMEHAFKMLGGTAEQARSTVESFTATLRNNPGLEGFVKGLGVDLKADRWEQILAVVEKLSAKPHYVGAQQAGMLGIDEETFRMLSKRVAEAKRLRDEYAKTAGTFGLNPEKFAEDSAKLSRAWDRLWSTMTTIFDRAVSTFYSGLTRYLEWHDATLKKFGPAIDFFWTNVAKGIEVAERALSKMQGIAQPFFDYLGAKAKEFVQAGGFLKVIERIGEAAKTAADYLGKAWDIVNRIGANLGLGGAPATANPFFGPSAANENGPPGGKGALGAFRRSRVGRWWGENAPTWAGGNAESGAPNMRRGRRAGGGPVQGGQHYTGSNAQVLRQAARDLGTTPEDLATVISYETGGTFSPSIRGGAGNRHIGLIQFGIPEQAKYGANQQQSFAEQMGAVTRYLKHRGFKPGMGIEDLYSTINAGRPGKPFASDRPGMNVRSHVERMQREQAGRVKRFLGSPEAPATPPIVPKKTDVPDFKGFDVRRFDMSGQPATPAGMSSINNQTSTDNRRTVTMSPTYNTTIHGAGNPQATADSIARIVGGSNDLALRNVTSAVG